MNFAQVGGYRRAVYICWRCKLPTYIYNLEDHIIYTKVCPPLPLPDNVREIGWGPAFYYGNVCPCGAVLGDGFLYNLPGPFCELR